MLKKLITILTLGLTGKAFAETSQLQLNMTKGVTEVSNEIYSLHMTVLWICVAIGFVVFGLMIYSLITHRKSKGAVAANFHESTTVEIIWTIIPFIILVAVAVPATKSLIKLEDGSGADMSIKITGYQWKWSYDYIDQNLSFFSNLAETSSKQVGVGMFSSEAKDFSTVDLAIAKEKRMQNPNYLLEVDNRLVVPINKKIRLLLTSDDVIHSWWVPATGVKQDAIPGYVNDAWMRIEKPGIYRGQCAELCGSDHGFMPIVVEAVNESDYQRWLAGKKQQIADADAAAGEAWSKEDLMARGKKVYMQSCAACHGQTGAGIPGAFPGMTGSAIVLGDVENHLDIVLNGKAGTAMAAYKKQLNDVDLAAVITFERNALGNNVGDILQPSAVKAAR